jgi:hypothetical protein
MTAPALAIALSVVLAACGGDDDSADVTTTRAATTTTTAVIDLAAATLEITNAFHVVFDGARPAAEKMPLIEDGDDLTEALGPPDQADVAATLTTAVTDVTVLSAADCDEAGVAVPCARVTHDILLGGAPALAGQESYAVLIGGRWRVAKASFCGLLALTGQDPERCG